MQNLGMATTKSKLSLPEVNKEFQVTELASRVGISKSHVSLILGRKRMPSLPIAAKIASAMGISIDELYHQRLTAA